MDNARRDSAPPMKGGVAFLPWTARGCIASERLLPIFVRQLGWPVQNDPVMTGSSFDSRDSCALSVRYSAVPSLAPTRKPFPKMIQFDVNFGVGFTEFLVVEGCSSTPRR